MKDIPAFPENYADRSMSSGMTLRDWFAGQALNGMLSFSQDTSRGNWSNNSNDEDRARGAYTQADAMLLERERKG